MNRLATRLDGPVLIEPAVHGDARGFFLETFRASALEELGLHCWFRYEKYREDFTNDDVVIAVDETPVGVFVEIEGGEDAIHETARALGFTPADYITDSYRFLFLQHRDANGIDGPYMVFAVGASE